jgi:thioredoxin reductase (NADPH)
MLSPAELTRIPLFTALGPEELEYLSRTVPDIHVAPGEYVVHEGTGRALVIIVEGRMEVTKVMDGEERVIAQRLPGTLFGEVPIILNSPFLASLRALEPSRVIRVEPKVFHTLAASVPEIAAVVGKAAFERIGGLQDLAKKRARPELLLIGPRGTPAVEALRRFVQNNQIELETLAPDDPAVETLAPADATAANTQPVVRLPDGGVLIAPSVRTLARAVGLSVAPSEGTYDVVIVGGGPAGMAAAVYGASEGLRTVLVEREAPGGQAGTSSRIENYLGFPFGVSGDELSARALRQARRLGAEIVVTRSIERIDATARTLTLDGGDELRARAIVLAMGVAWRRLSIPSLDRLTGRGVHYGAARTEAPSVQGRDIFLIGGGNSAGQAAVFFASHARTVTLVVRGAALEKGMSHYLVQQLRTKPNVKVALRTEVVGVHGDERLEAVDLRSHATSSTERHEAAGLFVFIGADASTDWLPAEISRDERGYVVTGADAARTGRWKAPRVPFLLETTAPGVFAVGDVRAGSVKRVASAVGDGSLAIAFVRQYLDAQG